MDYDNTTLRNNIQDLLNDLDTKSELDILEKHSNIIKHYPKLYDMCKIISKEHDPNYKQTLVNMLEQVLIERGKIQKGEIKDGDASINIGQLIAKEYIYTKIPNSEPSFDELQKAKKKLKKYENNDDNHHNSH